jgi:hypothetical protein
MAIFKSAGLATDLSGSIAGLTFSHNRGGMYIRNRSIPTNPNSSKQQNIRTILSEQSAAWRATSPSQKGAWNSWAKQNPITNAIGAQITLTGHQAFVQLNHRIVQSADTALTVPGITDAPAGLLTLSAVASVATQTCTLTFTATPIAATERLWIYAAVVDSPGITNVKNFYRLVAISAKTQATALNVGDEITAIFGPFVLYQQVHLKIHVYESTSGLLSQPKTYLETVGA